MGVLYSKDTPMAIIAVFFPFFLLLFFFERRSSKETACFFFLGGGGGFLYNQKNGRGPGAHITLEARVFAFFFLKKNGALRSGSVAF